MTEAQIRDDMKALYSKSASREAKYIRNLNRYQNNGTRREDLWSPYIYPQTYSTGNPVAQGTMTNLNIIRSAVDTITSKISQAKVRPFFNPTNGDLESRVVARQAQQFFDAYYDEYKVNEKAVLCIRDAAIFDMGVMWADDLGQEVKRLPPWCYFVDPAEYVAGCVTRAMVFMKNFPLASLRGRLKENGEKNALAKLSDEPWQVGQFVVYYDLYNGERLEFFGDMLVGKYNFQYDQKDGLHRRPFSEIFWSPPVKSFFSISLADELYTIQRQIDEQQTRIDAAFRNSLTNLILVPKSPQGQGIKASQLSNAPAITLEYTPSAEGTTPTVLTPNAIAQQFIEYQNLMEQKAYQLTGISQLSAQAKKPGGLDSGVALQTFEDIESERHNVITQNYIHFLVDIAKNIISTFPNTAKILPESFARDHMTWGQLKSASAKYTIQFSAGSALSKDPAVKLDQIQKLQAAGLIDQSMIASLLDLPDLQGAYSSATAAWDYIQKIVENAARKGDLNYLPVVPLEDLKKHTVTMIARLKEAGEKEEYVNNLLKLLEQVQEQINVLNAPEAPPMPEPMAPPMGPPPGPAPMGPPAGLPM